MIANLYKSYQFSIDEKQKFTTIKTNLIEARFCIQTTCWQKEAKSSQLWCVHKGSSQKGNFPGRNSATIAFLSVICINLYAEAVPDCVTFCLVVKPQNIHFISQIFYSWKTHYLSSCWLNQPHTELAIQKEFIMLFDFQFKEFRCTKTNGPRD